MLDLLKWRTHPDKITGCLSKLKEIDGSEIVKVYAASLTTWAPSTLGGRAPSTLGGRAPSTLGGREWGLLIAFCFFNPQFLQDTLDTLFGILDENSQKYGSKVFDSLVSFPFLDTSRKKVCLRILALGKLSQKWLLDTVRVRFLLYF